MNPTKQAKGTTGLHCQIDTSAYNALVKLADGKPLARYLEEMICKKAKIPIPERPSRGRPKKAAE